MRFERILVPVDFSEPSKRALEQAATLAERMGASLTVLHVFEPVDMPPVDPAFRPPEGDSDPSERVANLRDQLRQWVEPLGLAPERIESRVEIGSPVDLITDASADHDLIVIATHGRAGLRRLLLGSVTERVVRGARCSTLVVHERDQER
ncbi:Universal stress protein [Enhygromyxa salina]|uniref:Universal stress protein n=1 Tax=Enhygromyxa salina TaxID=215803 RepID=A0A2S9XRN2_9BACT|nr:universal stress protein [Enhygromyxa salina]PRP95523.1 Universal stress protein [Enhygromyxa salina]